MPYCSHCPILTSVASALKCRCARWRETGSSCSSGGTRSRCMQARRCSMPQPAQSRLQYTETLRPKANLRYDQTCSLCSVGVPSFSFCCSSLRAHVAPQHPCPRSVPGYSLSPFAGSQSAKGGARLHAAACDTRHHRPAACAWLRARQQVPTCLTDSVYVSPTLHQWHTDISGS